MSDAQPDPLLELFRSELREQSVILHRSLAHLEANTGDRSLIEEIAQAAHTIRGAARIVQMDALSRIMSGMENFFAAAQAGGRTPNAAEIQRWARFSEMLGELAAIDPAQWAEASLANLALLAADEPAPAPAKPVEQSRTAVMPPVAILVEAPAMDAAPFMPFGDESLLELFREEVRSHAAALNAGLLELEREPANPQRIEPLMRAAHSLKGAARIIGLDAAVHLAHEMEDAFVAAGAGRIRMAPPEIDVLLRGTDLLATLSEEDLAHWAIVRGAEIASLRQTVAAIARGESVSATPASTSPVAAALPQVVQRHRSKRHRPSLSHPAPRPRPNRVKRWFA